MARPLGRAQAPETFREAPLLDHLEELRFRIIYALGFWLAGSSVAYFFRNEITVALQRPIRDLVESDKVRLVTTSVTEPLIASFQIALFGGLVLALPFIVYQLWAFVAPGLTRQERLWGGPFILGMAFSFAVGVAFAYYAVLPYALPFMLNFIDGGVENLLTYARYINDVTTYLGAFGLLFELPITLFLLTKVGLVNARMLSAGRRIAVMVIVVVSAIITPTTDPVSLSFLAVPLYVLYEVGILLSRIAGRQNRAALEDTGFADD